MINPNKKTIYFFAKELPGLLIYTLNTELTCGDIDFSDNDRAARKRGAPFPSSVVGAHKFSGPGRHTFELRIDELVGSYICLGIISTQHNVIANADQYSLAHCVCSDNTSYNVQLVSGALNMLQGDTLKFVLNFDDDYFEARGHNDKFVYRANNVKDKEYYMFFGYSASAIIKISIV